MNIRPFDHDKDIRYVKEWLTYRNLNFTTLPKHGFIASHGEIPVAIGFFRQVEGDWVLFDSLITDPTLDKDLRHLALDRLTEKMIKVAKYYKVKGILAYSLDDNTIVRAVKHGFTQLPHEVLSLAL